MFLVRPHMCERAREWEGGRPGLNYRTGPLLLSGINARF